MRTKTVPLRVVHVTPSFYPAHVYGGPTGSLFALTRALSSHGHEVRVLTTNANGPAHVLDVDTAQEQELEPGLTVRYARRMGHTASPHLLRLLPEYLRWADVVHLTAVYSFPTFPTLALCRSWDRPLVWSPRGSLQRWQSTRRPGAKRLWERACRLTLPPRVALHVTSREEGEQSRARLPGVPSVTIPNCVEVPASVEYAVSEGPLRLLFLGRIDPIKGLENLLDACALLQKRGVDWSLALGGVGDPRYVQGLRERAFALGIGPRLRLLGWVDTERKAAAFRQADALILPSHTENFGMAAAEALAHGVPVIAARGTPWSILDDAGCGFWVDNSPRSLADAIARMASGDRAGMSERARSWARVELGPERTARQMTELYEALCAGPLDKTAA